MSHVELYASRARFTLVAGESQQDGADLGYSSAARQRAALDAALVHLVGQSRAWLLQCEASLDELEGLRDGRTSGLIEALGLTLEEPPRPGTLRHLERAASELLRSTSAIKEALE